MKFRVYETTESEIEMDCEFPIYRKRECHYIDENKIRIDMEKINQDGSSINIWIDNDVNGEYISVDYERGPDPERSKSLSYLINKDNEYACTKEEFDDALRKAKAVIEKCEA